MKTRDEARKLRHGGFRWLLGDDGVAESVELAGIAFEPAALIAAVEVVLAKILKEAAIGEHVPDAHEHLVTDREGGRTSP